MKTKRTPSRRFLSKRSFLSIILAIVLACALSPATSFGESGDALPGAPQDASSSASAATESSPALARSAALDANLASSQAGSVQDEGAEAGSAAGGEAEGGSAEGGGNQSAGWSGGLTPLAAGDLQLSLKWLDAPSGQDQNMSWSSPTQSRENQLIKYSLGITTQNTSYDTGQLTVRVKLPLWLDRNNASVLPSMIGIPQAPTAGSPTAPFNYTIEGDELVIRNTAPTDGASNYSIQMQYTVNPWNTIDQSTSTFTATGVGNDGQGNNNTATSNPISFTMDTEAITTAMQKSDPQPMYYWNTELTGGKPMPADFANYRWVSYRVTMSGRSNQPYQVVLNDIASPGGEAYAVSNEPAYPQNQLNGSDYTVGADGQTITSKNYTDSIEQGPANGTDRMLRVLVRYPLGNDGDVLTNSLTQSVKGIDGKDNASQQQSSVNYTWKNFVITPTEPPARIKKYSDLGSEHYDREIWSKMVLLRNGLFVDLEWGMVGNFDLYPGVNYPAGQTYSGEVADDYANFRLVDGVGNTSSDPWVRMTEKDYYYSRAVISGDSYLVNRTTGEREYYAQGNNGPVIKVWAQSGGSSTWVQVDSFYAGNIAYSNGAGGVTSAPRTVTLPAQTTAVKTTFEGAQDHLTLRTNLYGGILPSSTSTTLANWFANPANDNRRLRLQNFSYYKVYNQDGSEFSTPPAAYNFNYTQGDNAALEASDRAQYGTLLNRATAQLEVLDMVGRSDTGKVASAPVNDLANRQVNVQFWLNSIEAFQGLSDAGVTELINNGWQPPSRDEAVFYDLLPLGTFYNENLTKAVYDIKGNVSTFDMEVETFDNYRGTGRQLVVLKVKAKQANQNYVASGDVTRPGQQPDGTVTIGPSTWNQRGATGMSVMFTASIPWDNVPYANNGLNVAAYQVPEASPINGNGSSDNGSGNSIQGSDGRPVFYDLRGNGVTNITDTQYMNLQVPINVAVSTGAGLSKLVRADEDGPLATYNTGVQVERGGGYTYQLRVGAGESTQMRDVVLFDILESAVPAGGESWKGTLDSITLNYAVQTGIAPVVYYSTTPGLSYTGLSPASLSDSSVWSTTMPADKSTITAVAVDLRKATNGSDFVFPAQAGTQVLLHFTAPSTRQNAATAYNRAAYYSTSVPTVGDPTSNLLVSSTAEVHLPRLTKTASITGGTDGANATTLTAGQQVTYSLAYNAWEVNSDPLSVSDKVPLGMTLVPGSIRFTPPGSSTPVAIPDSAYDAGTRTITWPSYTQTVLGDAHFSFTVTVDALANGDNGVDYQLYTNQAQAIRGSRSAEESEVSETITHQQRNRWAVLAKTAALVSGVTADSADAAHGGTTGPHNSGTNASPVITELGQIVEYHLTLTNTGAQQLSGNLEVSDTLPAGTTYIPGSARVVFFGGVNPSVATGSIDDSGSTLKWTITGMSHQEVAYISFRLAAPKTAFAPGDTTSLKGEQVFSNYAQLRDVDKDETSRTLSTYHVVGETRVRVEKSWVDDDPGTVERPDGILVQLFANNTVHGNPVRVTSADNWQALWEGLPRWDASGKEIVYTAAEVGDTGEYQTSYSSDTFAITNHYSPGWTSRTVVKTWEDNNNAAGLRPSSIQVQLLADGEPHGDPVTLDAAGKWQYVWNNLPMTTHDVPIVYTFEEVGSVPSYTTTHDQKLGIITNTYTPPPPPLEPSTPPVVSVLPGTGDDTVRLVLLAVLATAGLVVVASDLLRKRRNKRFGA